MSAEAGEGVGEDSSDPLVVAKNALLELPRLAGPVQKTHFLAVSLSHLYGVSPKRVASFSKSLSPDSPIVASLVSLASLDCGEHRALVTLALRALYFVLLDTGTAISFSQAYEYVVPRLVGLCGLAKEEDISASFGTADGNAAKRSYAQADRESDAFSDDGAFLSATFIPNDLVLEFDQENGCDQLADAASSLLSHLALHSATTRKQLCTDRNLNDMLKALSKVSLGEILTPHRLINVINIFLFLLSLTSASEMMNLLVDLVYRRNFKGIVIELGNCVFLNNLRWHALYAPQAQSEARVRSTECGVYTLEAKKPIFESQDIYLLKQQLIRLIQFCMLIV